MIKKKKTENGKREIFPRLNEQKVKTPERRRRRRGVHKILNSHISREVKRQTDRRRVINKIVNPSARRRLLVFFIRIPIRGRLTS